MSRLAQLSNRFYDSIRSGASRRAAEGEAGTRGFGHLKGHSYCLVVSYRRSGEPVATPVWFGVDANGRMYFRTDPDSAKVKRILNDPRVRVAPCTTRGKPKGPAAEGRARVLAPHEFRYAEATIQSNYGLFRKVYEGGVDRIMDAGYVKVVPAEEAEA